jgi:hypothetical protein
MIEAILTGATCSEACWEAREEKCACSCGGRNHGIMRTADGVRPERTAKIDGFRYKLLGIGYEGLFEEARRINEAAGITFVYACTSRDRDCRDIPAKLRTATKDQVAKWPELAAYRDNLPENWRRDNPDKVAAHWPGMPSLLWVKV